MPLVPDASIGGSGVFTQTSTPLTIAWAIFMS